MNEGYIRAFIGIELPKTLIPEIEKIDSILKAPGVKLVKPEMVHLTIKFLGNIREKDVKNISSALSQINCKRFKANIRGVGAFQKIRVIWIGAEGDFEILHNEVESVLTPFKFGKDKNFTPHLTLARVKYIRNKEELIQKITKLKDINLGTIDVDSIYLKKSTLTRNGPIYENLQKIEL